MVFIYSLISILLDKFRRPPTWFYYSISTVCCVAQFKYLKIVAY